METQFFVKLRKKRIIKSQEQKKNSNNSQPTFVTDGKQR
jgi:hypothetical protein